MEAAGVVVPALFLDVVPFAVSDGGTLVKVCLSTGDVSKGLLCAGDTSKDLLCGGRVRAKTAVRGGPSLAKLALESQVEVFRF